MKKIIWVFFLIIIALVAISLPTHASRCPGATGIVPCGLDTSCPCEISDFFEMLYRLLGFIMNYIVVPLAIIMLIVGGLILLGSAGNPNAVSLGKKTIYAAIIGLVLIYGSWLIINFILSTLGYVGTWSVL